MIRALQQWEKTGISLLSKFHVPNILVDYRMNGIINFSVLQYSTVELLKSGKLWSKVSNPSYSILDIGAWKATVNWGCFTQPFFTLDANIRNKCQIWQSIGSNTAFLTTFEAAVWQNLLRISRNHTGTKICACGTKDTFLQLWFPCPPIFKWT